MLSLCILLPFELLNHSVEKHSRVFWLCQGKEGDFQDLTDLNKFGTVAAS
jgi:hypothetical protein